MPDCYRILKGCENKSSLLVVVWVRSSFLSLCLSIYSFSVKLV